MTKPTRNRIWCPDCRRPKMLFETERKANDFIKWNGDEIYTYDGMLRAYYCPACCGWHISHHEHKESYDTNTNNLLGAYRRNISKHGKTRIDRLLTGEGEQQIHLAGKIFGEISDMICPTPYKEHVKGVVNDYMKEHGITDEGGVLTYSHA